MKTVKLAHKHSSKLRTDYEEVDTKLTESRVKYNAAEEEGDQQGMKEMLRIYTFYEDQYLCPYSANIGCGAEEVKLVHSYRFHGARGHRMDPLVVTQAKNHSVWWSWWPVRPDTYRN